MRSGDTGGPVGLTTWGDAVSSSAAPLFMDTVRAVAEQVRA